MVNVAPVVKPCRSIRKACKRAWESLKWYLDDMQVALFYCVGCVEEPGMR